MLGLALSWAEPAYASSIAISPVNIVLSRDNPTALLTLHNLGTESASFSLSMAAWNQSESGKMELTPTSDIVFFPTLLTLAPGEQRKIRIGTALQPAQLEQTFRIVLEELPRPRTQAPGLQIQVLSKITVPIFLEPTASRVATDINEVSVKRGRLVFRLNNVGTVHVVPGVISVVGADGGGNALFDSKLKGWYLLGGGSRLYAFAMPGRTCAKVRTLSITVDVNAALVRKSLETPAGACAR